MIETSAIIRQAYVPQKPARSKGIAKTKCRGPRVSKGGSEAGILLQAWIYRPPSGRASALSTVPTVLPDLYRRLAANALRRGLPLRLTPQKTKGGYASVPSLVFDGFSATLLLANNYGVRPAILTILDRHSDDRSVRNYTPRLRLFFGLSRFEVATNSICDTPGSVMPPNELI